MGKLSSFMQGSGIHFQKYVTILQDNTEGQIAKS